MGKIEQCGNTKATEITDAKGGIHQALRKLDFQVFGEDSDEEITKKLSELELDLETINHNFNKAKQGQYVVYTKGKKVQILDSFDPNCHVPFEPLIPDSKKRLSKTENGEISRLKEIPFPHLVAFPELRVQKAEEVVEDQKRTGSAKDLCAKFTGYNLYYITGQEGVLYQDAWMVIPYLVKKGIGHEISNGERFVSAQNGKIQTSNYHSQDYQEHIGSYLDAIEQDDTPKAVGLHFSRTAYSGTIIKNRNQKEYKDANLNSHSAIAQPKEKDEIYLSGSVRQTLNQEYTKNGTEIDWNNPLLDRIKVEFPPESTEYYLSEVLDDQRSGSMILHDTFLEESFGKLTRKRSLTLTLLTMDSGSPLFTAVRAAELNPKYKAYLEDPGIKELQTADHDTFGPGKNFAEMTTKNLKELPAYGEGYFKLQQIYYWLFNISPDELKNGQNILILKNTEEIEKYFEILSNSLSKSHDAIDSRPPETIKSFLTRVIGSNINASETEIQFFFDKNPKATKAILEKLVKSDPQSYLAQVMKKENPLNQTISVGGTLFLDPNTERGVGRIAEDSYYAHKAEQKNIFKETKIKIPENFPFSYEMLQAVAPNPRNQIALVAIWKNESGNESWWKSALGLTRRNGARVADEIGWKDEESVGEMQVKEYLVRKKFTMLEKRLRDFPSLYKENAKAIKKINDSIKAKKPKAEINELIEDFLIGSPAVTLVAAQLVNKNNLSSAKTLAKRTGIDWEESIFHQARILANAYNENPVRARTIEDYNRWILMAQELGVNMSDLQTRRGRVAPLDKQLFKKTVKTVINFIKANWANPKVSDGLIKKISLPQFSQRAKKVLKIIDSESPKKLLASEAGNAEKLLHTEYSELADIIQEALKIKMSEIPIERYNEKKSSKAVLRGNYGARPLMQLTELKD